MANGFYYNGTTNTIETTGSLNTQLFGVTGSLLGTATGNLTSASFDGKTLVIYYGDANFTTASVNITSGEYTGSFNGTLTGSAATASYVSMSAGPNITINYENGGISISGSGGGGTVDVSTYLSSSWTSSAMLTSSFNSWTGSTYNVFTGSYNTGSFTGSFTGASLTTGSLFGTASANFSSASISGQVITFFTPNGTAGAVTVPGGGGGSQTLQDTTTLGNISSGSIVMSGSYDDASGNVYAINSILVDGTLVHGYVTDTFTLGGATTLAVGSGSHAEGFNTTALGFASHAEGGTFNGFTSGFKVLAEGAGSHAEGGWSTAVGDGSHSEGAETTAGGLYSHAEGNNTIAEGNGSHAEGNQTIAIANTSHAEGNQTKTIGAGSHAEGFQTTTTSTATAAHSEGYITTAKGPYSHAEGRENLAEGSYSHAEGGSSLGDTAYAAGDYSHAEGTGQAFGFGSHSEGWRTTTTANSYYAHSEGQNSTADDLYAHAGGYNTIAQSENQTVVGVFNQINFTGSAWTGSASGWKTVGFRPFIVGIGNDNSAASRGNGLEVVMLATAGTPVGTIVLPSLSTLNYASNAAAVGAGLTPGMVYRNGTVLNIVV